MPRRLLSLVNNLININKLMRIKANYISIGEYIYVSLILYAYYYNYQIIQPDFY